MALEISNRVQNASALIVVSRYASSHEDPLVRTAGMCMAIELAQGLLGLRPSAHYHRLVTQLGAEVANEKFSPVSAAEREPVVMADRLPPRGAGDEDLESLRTREDLQAPHSSVHA